MLFASSRAGKLLLSCEINSRISTYVSCNTNQRFPRSPQYMLFTRGTTLFECPTIAFQKVYLFKSHLCSIPLSQGTSMPLIVNANVALLNTRRNHLRF